MFKASVHYCRRAVAYGGQHHVVIRRRLMTTTTTTAAAFTNNNTEMNIASKSLEEPNIINAAEEEAEDSYSKYPRRNKGIAEVIRAGWAPLNQTALDIQNSSVTRKPLFTNIINGSDDMTMQEEQVSPRIKSEEHRILSVAKDCLHQIAQSKQDEEMAVFSIQLARNKSVGGGGQVHHNALGDDTMIVLLNVEIKKGSREAILYWCLPYDLLLDDNITSRQKQFLEFRVQQQLEQKGNKMLQRRVHSILRHYYPPKLRLEPATNDQLYNVLKELSDW